MKKYIIIAILATVCLIGCSKDYDIQSSVFIEDPIYTGLPEYTEWGYNTFGAYIDRQPFISNRTQLPAKIIVISDTLNFILNGELLSKDISLKFSFIGISPQTYKELNVLNGQNFNLTSSNCIVTMTKDGATEELNILNGEILFKKVQNLTVDKELNSSILSGTFQFQTFLNNEPTTIQNGRFDLSVGYDNFYNL
jgi:hypothetical protein